MSSHHCIYAAHNTPQAVQDREGKSVTWPLYKSVSISSFSNGTKLHAFSSKSLFTPNSSRSEAQTPLFKAGQLKDGRKVSLKTSQHCVEVVVVFL